MKKRKLISALMRNETRYLLEKIVLDLLAVTTKLELGQIGAAQGQVALLSKQLERALK